jgi:Ca-activated chloride channel family protein
MKTIEDDPHITAYLLNELPPHDRAAFEKQLAADPALARLVEEFQQSASLFSEALPHEAADLGLSLAQRESILRAASGTAQSTRSTQPGWAIHSFTPACGWVGSLLILGLGAWIWFASEMMNPEPPAIPPLPLTANKTSPRASSFVLADEPIPPSPEEPALLPSTEELLRSDALVAAPEGGAAGEVAPLDVTSAATSFAVTAPPPAVGVPVAEPHSATSGSGFYRRTASQFYKSSYRSNFGPHRVEASAEAYAPIPHQGFHRVTDAASATSTFGADVDTAAYANVRRFLQDGQLPPPDAVRIEELLNYFTYAYPAPDRGAPFAASVETASAPWAPKHRLVRVGIRARDIPPAARPPMNLVFLVDVSGSMQSPHKLPLVQQSLRLLTQGLQARDRVAIVTYAGASRVALDSTPDKRLIREGIDRLSAGGSTNGEGGIRMAYQIARTHFIEGGVNRVILCTDGDFNVGTTSRDDLIALVERERASGVFLSVYGFGMGNLKEATLEQLANKGNGAYGYIDSFAEAQKTFVQQLAGTLVPVAKDVKFQLEFNPTRVAAWRQIGYENRQLARADFNDDTKDAGEVGSGHTVTALYEIVPVGVEPPALPDPHRYFEEKQKSETRNPKPETGNSGSSAELLFLKIRHKLPHEDTSRLMSFPVQDKGGSWERASEDFRFAAAVAGFGMLLRESPYAGSANWNLVQTLARSGRGVDPHGHRAEFLRLVQLARALSSANE